MDIVTSSSLPTGDSNLLLPREQFINALRESLLLHSQSSSTISNGNSGDNDDEGDVDFIKLILSDNNNKNMQEKKGEDNTSASTTSSILTNLKSMSGRLVKLKAGLRVQLNYRYTTNDQVKNYKYSELPDKIMKLIDSMSSGTNTAATSTSTRAGSNTNSSGNRGGGYKTAILYTKDLVYELSLKRGSHGKIRITNAHTASPSTAGDITSSSSSSASGDREDRMLSPTEIYTINTFVEILKRLIDRSYSTSRDNDDDNNNVLSSSSKYFPQNSIDRSFVSLIWVVA